MTSGQDRREQSEQFSLKELMKLEDERVQTEQRERLAREEAAVRMREEESRRRREEANARENEAAAARERARRDELDTVARREALQKSVIEQARLEVEVRGRAEERELERRHELELQRLRAEGRNGQLGALAGATFLGGVVMLLVAVGVHFGVVKPTSDRRLAELQMNVVAEGTRADDLGRQLADERHKTERLEKALASAMTTPAPAKDADELRTKGSSGSSKWGGPATHKAPVTPPPPVCLKGDPLCPTITR